MDCILEHDDETALSINLQNEDAEDDDEPHHDWTQMLKLTQKSSAVRPPKRGEKDYEPDGTKLQEELLCAAKNAMFSTLSNSIRGTMPKSQVKAYLDQKHHVAIVPHPRGIFTQTMGHVDESGRFVLAFYEFLYLVERGTVTPYLYTDEGNSHLNEKPLSVQDIYLCFKSSEETDKYAVYGHLKRLGFIVRYRDDTSYVKTTFFPENHELKNSPYKLPRILTQLCDHSYTIYKRIFKGLYRWFQKIIGMRFLNFEEIYKYIPKICHDFVPKSVNQLKHNHKTIPNNDKLKIEMDLWKPHPNFKKKFSSLPDYQVVIFNKNDPNKQFPCHDDLLDIFEQLDYKFDFIHTMSDGDEFWNQYSYANQISRTSYLENQKGIRKIKDVPSEKSELHTSRKHESRNNSTKYPSKKQCLKNGYRSFLLAIIDNGLLSFTKLAEADFSSFNAWEELETRKNTNRLKFQANK